MPPCGHNSARRISKLARQPPDLDGRACDWRIVAAAFTIRRKRRLWAANLLVNYPRDAGLNSPSLRLRRKSAARWAWAAALNISRLSSFNTASNREVAIMPRKALGALRFR